MVEFMGWVAVAIALLGTVLNIQKKRSGFGCWMISNLYWAFHNLNIKEYSQSLLYTVFFSLAVFGFINWESDEEDDAPLCS